MEPFDRWKQDPGWSDWRWQLRHAVRDSDCLAAWLGLSPALSDAVRQAAARYPLCVTPYYLALARRPTPDDPIVRQILPDPAELAAVADSSPDPLAEGRDSPVPGLVHRYADRALLVATHRCAVLCRHCMRKRFWQENAAGVPKDAFAAALTYIRAHTEIHEVLVSGGDPLMLPEATLFGLLAALRGIAHVEIIRIGSRLPVVMPQRFTPEFCAGLAGATPLWLATQFNHPCELTRESEVAAGNLLRAGIPVVNQTVLLAGVNDEVETLARLCTGLLRQRIKPYYLFHGDPVAGTMHFRTGIARGLELLGGLERSVSGLAVPAFALDLPGGGGKIRLEPSQCCGFTPEGGPLFRDRHGQLQAYPEPGS